MNFLRKALLIVARSAVSIMSSAQISKLSQRMEIATVEVNYNTSEETIGIFKIPQEGTNQYYLSLGHVGIGDKDIQIDIDPLSELFIPLGSTLEESQNTMQELFDLYKSEPETTIEKQGCLAILLPNDKLEPVKVTYRKVLLSRMLEFVLERDGYDRAVFIQKSDFGSLFSSFKFYRKLHKKEQ